MRYDNLSFFFSFFFCRSIRNVDSMMVISMECAGIVLIIPRGIIILAIVERTVAYLTIVYADKNFDSTTCVGIKLKSYLDRENYATRKGFYIARVKGKGKQRNAKSNIIKRIYIFFILFPVFLRIIVSTVFHKYFHQNKHCFNANV